MLLVDRLNYFFRQSAQKCPIFITTFGKKKLYNVRCFCNILFLGWKMLNPINCFESFPSGLHFKQILINRRCICRKFTIENIQRDKKIPKKQSIRFSIVVEISYRRFRRKLIKSRFFRSRLISLRSI